MIRWALIFPLDVRPRLGEVNHAYYTVQKSLDLLGYEMRYDLKEGLKMVAWAKQIGPQQPTYTLPLEITKGAGLDESSQLPRGAQTWKRQVPA